jgi:hypothetical protein
MSFRMLLKVPFAQLRTTMEQTTALATSCNQKILTLFIASPMREVISAQTAKCVHIRLPFIKLCVVARRHNWAAQVSQQQDHHWDVVDFLCQWCSSKNLGSARSRPPMEARAYRDSRSNGICLTTKRRPKVLLLGDHLKPIDLRSRGK